MDDIHYSARQVATLIAYEKTESEIIKLVRKIRHWSAEDILVPVSGKSTGTGNSRLYDKNQVYCAALILELTGYGITMEMLETLPEWLDRSVMKHENWQASIDDTADYILAMTWRMDHGGMGGFQIVQPDQPMTVSNEMAKKTGMETPSAILLNLRFIFRRIQF
ncbi:MAG: hypothetical protein RIM72_14515 [Alphaproteobacteria bacterium]